VRPNAFRQFGEVADTFCLVTDADRMDEFIIDNVGGLIGTYGTGTYRQSLLVPVSAGDDLGNVLARDVPAEADVVVICRETFLSSPDDQTIGQGRRVVVMPCASTPVSLENIRYFLTVIERTDPAAQATRAERFFEAVEEAGELRLVDREHGTMCDFDPVGGDVGGDYVWNQQAGFLAPGEQQIAPAGELSVLPMEITDFDADRRLALNGTLTLRGAPIVHAGYDEALAGPQARLYERLTKLQRHSVLLTLRDGAIVDVRGNDQGARGSDQGGGQPAGSADVVATLEELFAEDPRYRTIWELGFGINTNMRTVPGNCGLNEPYGATGGVVHIGIGLTPFTRFALTFLCPGTVLTDSAGEVVLGSAGQSPASGRSPRRINRTYAASCGCH
jgi:hypothetical protein